MEQKTPLVMPLLELRQNLDIVDREILQLLEERMNLVEHIRLQKERLGLPVYVPQREHIVTEKWSTKAGELGLSKKHVGAVLSAILDLSKFTQRSRR